jgi:hypothetical protein
MSIQPSFFISIAFLLLSMYSVQAQKSKQYSLLKFHIENKLQIKDLLDFGLNLDDDPLVGNTIEVILIGW